MTTHAPAPPVGFRHGLAWTALAAVFLLMTLGNIVSATGSGLACPDWPLCHGSVIPPLEPAVLIEYSHRLAAAMASGLLVATIVVTIRGASDAPVRRLGVVLLVLLGVQIGLGGITVLLRLPHLVSTAHLVTALLILAGLVLLCARGRGPTTPERTGKIARLCRAGLVALLVQLALGGYVRHSGAGLACPDFPLCSGSVLPEHWLGAVHWVHRWLGVALLGLFLHVSAAGRRTALRVECLVVAVLATCQVGLGIATVLVRLDPVVRALHAATGYALWATLVWLAARSGVFDRLIAAGPRVAAHITGVAARPARAGGNPGRRGSGRATR